MDDKLARFTEKAGIPVILTGYDLQILYANSRALKVCGYSLSELQTMSFNELLNPVHQQDIITMADETTESHSTAYQGRIIRKNNEQRRIDFSMSKDEQQQLLFITMSDVSPGENIEKELQESRRKLMGFLNNLPGIAFRCKYDRHWTMLFLSRSFSSITGYQPEDILHNNKKSFYQLIFPDDRRPVHMQVDNAIRKHLQYQVEYRIIRKDSKIAWIFEQGNAWENQNGDIEYIEGIMIDITKRKFAEQLQQAVGNIAELSMEEIEFDNHTYFDKTRQYISTVMIANNFSVLQYDEFENKLDILFSSDETLIQDMMKVDDIRRTLSYQVIADQKPVLLTDTEVRDLAGKDRIRLYGREGRQWMGVPLRLIHGNKGVVILQNYDQDRPYTPQDLKALGLMAHQISMAINRKDAVNALKKREKYYRDFYMNLPESYQLMDPEGHLMMVNSKWLQMMGYQKRDVIGKSFDWFWAEEEKMTSHKFLSVLKKKYRMDHFLLKLKTRKGRTINVVFTGHGEQDLQGNLTKIHGVFADVTPIKDAEQAMRRAKEKAEENDMLKSSFLANMSHEIRSPMNAILGFSELLKSDSLPANRRLQYIKLVQERGQDLLRIIDDIIDISKLEAGSLHLNYEMVNLSDFLSDLKMELLQERKRQQKEDIAFYSEINQNLRNISWKADKIRIRQILMNFFSNAFKFTDEGKVVLEVDKQAGNIAFKVHDTGIGIPADQQELIFERFRQVDLKYRSSKSGTGLGLSISRNLAENMDGSVSVKSVYGKGSTFTLELPLRNLKEGRTAEDFDMPRRGDAPPVVLIISHSKDNFHFLKEMLEDTGVNICWARTSEEAQRFAGVLQHDLILMDVDLPDSGVDFLAEQIKKQRPSVPVIAQIKYDNQDKLKKVNKGIFNDYLKMPASKPLIHAIINKYIKAGS